MGDTAYFEKIERSLNTGKQVAVLGAGTMGCGIAAHLANLGYEVRLFDTSLEAATAGLTRATSAKPPHFTTPQSLSRIQLNSIAEDLHKLADCSWVCEAIVEKLEVKKELYSAITPYLNDHAILSTNTSGLEINLLAEPLPDSLRSRFIGIHFFNPPRYLKLIELIQTDSVSPLLTKIVSDFLEHKIGKRVVRAKDTPGFIANRFGMWSMYKAIHVAETLGLTVEEADAITGPFLGRPKSGSFRLSDIVGLDVMQDIASNLQQRCPSDTHTEALAAPRSVEFLLEKGWIGEKAGQGFFRRNGKDILSLDLVTHSYRERIEPTLPALLELGSLPLAERLAQSIRRKDVVGEFMRLYLHPLLSYAQTLAPEICFSYSDFDRVMEWGFGWQAGPFKMIDMIGEFWNS